MVDSDVKKSFELYQKRDKLISRIMDKQNEIKDMTQEVGKINQQLSKILNKMETKKKKKK